MEHRLRGAVGSLALAALLGGVLVGGSVPSVAAQDTPVADAETSQTQADAAAAALATGKYPYGTELMLLNGQASVKNAAGSEAATLTEIDEGTTVTVLAGPEPIGGVDWYQVETEGGITGWVAIDQFGIAKGGPQLAAGTERQVVTESLNLRGSAGTSGEIISGLVQGDTVTILSGPDVADDLDWYQVETVYGEQGWLAGVYLGPVGEDAAAVGAQTEPTSESVDAAVAAFPDGSVVFIEGDGDPVNLRADASIEAEIVGQLDDGASGTITGGPITAGDYDWYPATFGTGDTAVSGFVAGEFLTGGITVGATATVADGPLNIRLTASTESDPIGQLETGDTVTIVSGPTDADGIAWFEITSGDLTGFVAGRYLGAPSA
ncbi:MAG: SH3 domain-containing protein [Thermomicrobiales bacterium]|nr:SH3 domain-containing protein [Thermomicrobiales bacterium]